MKKIIYIFLASSMGLASCSKMLDIEPTDSISSDVAITDKAGVDKAIVGAYDALQQVGLYGRNRVILGDLAADNLVWTGTTYDYYEVDNNTVSLENSLIEGMWAGAYDGINRVNNILLALPGIGDITDAERATYEGEALFMRGLFYFNLLKYFGGVPIKTLPTLDLNDIDQPRNTLAEVYDQVIADLLAAEAKLPPGNISEGRPGAFSATALLARVYLTRFQAENDPGYAGLAIEKADKVIAEGGYSLVGDFASLYAGNNSEIIFQVVFSVQDRNRLAEYFFPRSLTGRYEVGPSESVMQSYTPEDSLRYQATVAIDSTGVAYGYKYQDLSEGADAVIVVRLAEMYLIKAEALAYTGGDIATVRQNIDVVRSRAGLAPTEATSYEELKLAILAERRHEFAFEGHRWFDLVRTRTAIPVLGIQEYQTLFPIPLSEMTTNKEMEQNPGY
jgi:hypothetical protein